MFSPWARDFIRIASVDSAVKWVPGGDNLVKGIQCYELFGGIALKIHTFSFSFSFATRKHPTLSIVKWVHIQYPRQYQQYASSRCNKKEILIQPLRRTFHQLYKMPHLSMLVLPGIPKKCVPPHDEKYGTMIYVKPQLYFPYLFFISSPKYS